MNVSTLDPVLARRSRVLNILLLGTFVGTLVLLLWIVMYGSLGWAETQADFVQPLAGTVGMLAGILIVYALNRAGLERLSAWLFLIIITLVGTFADPDLAQVVNGYSSAVYVIPIITASVILPPRSSFFVAALVSAWMTALGIYLDLVPNVFLMVIFFVIALVSWISARSLERALDELRAINRELDQRVEERTIDLAEALAREHAEASKNQAVLSGIADGVIVFDNEGQAIVANPAIGRILELELDRILGSDIQALMGNDVRDEDQSMMLALLSDKEARRSSVKFEWGAKTLSVSFAPVTDDIGHVTGTVAVFRDYTREAEIDRMKSDFVSIVSHELRTPLTSIKGYLDLLLMGTAGPLTMQQSSFLEIAKDNSIRLNSLVADLLDISRIESGRTELDLQVVSISDIVDNVATSLQQQFAERNLTLTLDIPPGLPEIFGDPKRIAQILINLLSNAYKYTVEGGATVRARATTTALQVDVTDSGVGISPQAKEKLFSRFFRANDPTVRQQPGTGLGLNITKSLVEMHGGKIWVESTPGVGTTFSFTLPLPAGIVLQKAPDKLGAEDRVLIEPAGETEPEPAIPSGPWIMVVDDNEDVSQLFRLQLEKAGFRVTVVNQGSQVIQVARELRPELITLDLLMDVDGLAVLRELQSDPGTAEIPVIIVSVISEPEKGLALGAADYLVKPLEENQLLNCVHRVLDQSDGQARKKVLVVDDEIDIVGWLKHSLSHYGFEVGEAYDGFQALDAVQIEKPDLILLDLNMPRMDGRTTIRRLREDEETRHIPIVVLS
ncbi:MAG: response regulator, partial [Anaerolineae bacterium]